MDAEMVEPQDITLPERVAVYVLASPVYLMCWSLLKAIDLWERIEERRR